LHPFEDLTIEKVQNSNVLVFKFDNPPKIKHVTKLLEGVILPKAEITMNEFENRDQRKFGASFMIRSIERTLGI